MKTGIFFIKANMMFGGYGLRFKDTNFYTFYVITQFVILL